ncbi:formylglycine-generating enzyme family protein [Dolichospermum heterosporum]|uniref:formylglycine-generating enzyme family protein n=1 Tax=Dolichospermum heterosporum TaxID=747522 RepID=UPI0027B93659|nr:formylglycine-generating enzyme family protein [Dolichospermum heterosporum]
MDKTIEVENNLDWLNPDVLLEFIDKLREAGYSIGISQYIAAQDLILILISQGENFDNPERLRNLLAPIFCSSQLEQENFNQYFDDSFKSVSQNIFLTEETTAENQTSLEPEKSIKPRSLLLILPLIVIIFPGIPLFVIFNNVLNQPIVKPPNPPTTKPTNIPTKPPDIIPPTKPTNIPDKNSINCTENIPPNTINWPRELAFFLTPAALFLISRMWWFWLNRQLFLRRYGTTNQPELQNISIADFDIEQELFPTMIFMQIARNLRRRIPIPSNQLDIEKTIDATLRQGGWLKPIYRNYQILPEYLFLVNRTSFQDHQAQFIEEIIERLKKDNVLITSYFFDDDPLICFPSHGESSPLRLDEIISKYDHNYLIIVSDTANFFSVISGELEPWVNQFTSWKYPTFLTPKPIANWGYQEFQIAQEFMILPATAAGLEIFSQKPWNGHNLKPLSLQERGLERGSTIPIPQTLRLQSYRWLERNSLEPEKIATMLVSLREYLGEDSFYWFCACAVFPELQWNITIYLGNVLKTAVGKSLLEVDSLTNLARLPWFRSGYIPDWLRVDLIKELTQEQEQEIRTALKNLLNQVNHTSGNGWKLSIAKMSVKTISEDSLLQDYLFLDFMTKPSLLDLKVPEKFSQLLPKPKNQVSKKTQINRRRFLQMVGLGGAGLVTAVVGNQILKPKISEPIKASRTCKFEVLTVDSQGKIIDRVFSQATFFTEDLGNNITLEMVEIPAGSFMMGSPASEKGRSQDESPQHQVNVPAFAMGKFAVTQEQYQQVMGENPAEFKGGNRPVEQVSWNDAVEFCNKLNQISQKTGRKYRLPSEAEWEYACRAGTNTPFHFGKTITSDLANYNGSTVYAFEPEGKYRQETTEVGSFPPNSFGLYDMHGNVWEWCQDDWHDDYTNTPNNGIAWTSQSGNAKVLRGGSWNNIPGSCRSAYRNYDNRDLRNGSIGFRVVCFSAARTL